MSQERAILAVGTILRERYAVQSVLDSGNTGTVYLVKDLQLKHQQDHLFALKEITGLDQQARYQFTFRSMALCQLQHSALPRIHHVFNDDKRGCVYLVIDYVEGANLEMHRQQQPEGRFAWIDLQPLIEPLIDALTYLHHQEKPLIHGNIKPTTMIKSLSEKVVLVGLGSSQTLEQMRQSPPDTFACYRAPEYFDGKISERSDIYSLGATFYALLTGQAPIDALTRQKQVNEGRPEPLPLACEIVPDVSLPLAEVLQQALALDPGQRFASAQAFWEELQTLPVQPSALTPVPLTPEGDEFTPLLAKNELKADPAVNPPATQSVESKEHPILRRRTLLFKGAIICVLLLLSAGILSLAAIPAANQRTGNASQTPGGSRSASQTTTPGAAPTGQATAPGSTPTLGGYPKMLKIYHGYLNPVFPPPTSGTMIFFTLHVQHQNHNKISGSFAAPAYKNGKLINSMFTGTVTLSGNVQFTVIDISGSAIFAFNGVLRNSSPYSSTLDGSFHSCADGYGAICIFSKGPLSGSWIMQPA